MSDRLFVTACVLLVPGVLWASWIDYRQHRVPNWLNAAIAAGGLAAQAWFGGWAGAGQGLLGAMVGFGVLIVPWLMHGMGAGDVKLMAAMGMWLGPWLTLVSFCAGAVIGGIIAFGMIIARGRLWQAYANTMTILAKVSNRSTVFSEFGSAKSFGNTSQLLPYGVPLTLGALIVLFGQRWLFE